MSEQIRTLEALRDKWRADASKLWKSGWLQSIRRDAMEKCANELDEALTKLRAQ